MMTEFMRWLWLAPLLLGIAGCGGGPPLAMAGGKWANALRDPDASVRKKAAFTLGNIGPADPAVLPALVEGLRDADAGVRCEVILALVKYGPRAKEALPVLSELREHDREARVRDYAGKALDKLQPAR
jgi:HEAT repeat protein